MNKKPKILEDLLVNESFLNYYFQKNEADVWEWEEYQEENPETAALILEAKNALNSLSLKWSEKQIRIKFTALQNQISNYEESGDTIFVKSSVNKMYWAAAASIILVLSFIWLFNQNQISPIYKKLTEHKYLIETVNETEKPLLVLLSDGSSILLKKNSRLSYPKQFIADKREVFLDGEAFFEVAKNPQKPFYVYANEIVTKVIGTSFTIVANKKQKEINILVNTGKVSVSSLKEIQSNNSNISTVLVTENQKIVFDKQKSNFIKLPIIQENDIKQNTALQFEFKDVMASEVLNIINKSYGITIIFDEEIIRNCPITASLTDEPLMKKIELICQAIEAEYEVVEGQILITSKGCK